MSKKELERAYKNALELERKAKAQLYLIEDLRNSLLLKMEYGVDTSDIVGQKKTYVRRPLCQDIPSGKAVVLLSDDREVEVPEALLRWDNVRRN